MHQVPPSSGEALNNRTGSGGRRPTDNSVTITRLRMARDDVASRYNQIYSNDPNAFAQEPLPLVTKLASLLSPDCGVWDIGAGQGRNSIYLAKRGCHVRATEISQKAAELLAKRARDAGVTLDIVLVDALMDKPPSHYDAILCVHVLHHLNKKDAISVLLKMQRYTKKGGYNLITAFTQDGDFFRQNSATTRFYPSSKMALEQLYPEWRVIKSFEKQSLARARREDGSPYENISARVLLQRTA